MRGTISGDSHLAEEDTEPEEMSDCEYEREHQGNGRPELDQNSSSREAAVYRDQASQYESLSKVNTEDDYTVPDPQKTNYSHTPYYDDVKDKETSNSSKADIDNAEQSAQYDKLMRKEMIEDSCTAPERKKIIKKKYEVWTPHYGNVIQKSLSNKDASSIIKTKQSSHNHDKLMPKETTAANYAVLNQESIPKKKKVTLTPYYNSAKRKYSSSIAATINRTEQTYKCDNLLSGEYLEDSNDIPDQSETSNVVISTPYYDNIKMPETNITVNTCEYSEIPTVEKSRQANVAESNTSNQDSGNICYELEDIPKIKDSLTHLEIENKPQNLSNANSTNGKYSIIMLEASSTRSKGSMNDQVEWNRVTIDDTAVALASNGNREFCQTKQKSNSNFGKPSN